MTNKELTEKILDSIAKFGYNNKGLKPKIIIVNPFTRYRLLDIARDQGLYPVGLQSHKEEFYGLEVVVRLSDFRKEIFYKIL